MSTPSSILNRAADLIRDTAADTTKPRPNGHGWGVPGEEDGWEPDWAAVVSCAGYGGEDVVATDVRVGDARWIALLSPDVAESLADLLQQMTGMWRLYEDRAIRRAEMEQRVGCAAVAALQLAEQITGERAVVGHEEVPDAR